jgi:hypothetical protein
MKTKPYEEKSPQKRRKRCRVSSAASNPDTRGIPDHVDRWLKRLTEEVSLACDRFWSKTPERRRIEANRRLATSAFYNFSND